MHSLVAAHRDRIDIPFFNGDGDAIIEVASQKLSPDCFCQFSLSGKQFNVYFEIDQSTESVDSRAEQSIREKLVRYEAYQDSLVAWHNAQTASVSWPYFRVVFLTRSVERANHILWLARECARNANRHLVYAATQNAYLTEPRALQTPLFVDHHGRWQALVNVHPTSNFQRTPVRLTRPVTRLATVW